MLSEQVRRDHHITCAACATHAHPEHVPFQQHAIGCPMRAELLPPVSAAPPQPMR
jgi:hypothetical protein